jgi:GNAT superfamily N-acetyltransferase
MLDTGYSILDTRYWILDTGYSILDTGYSILHTSDELRVLSYEKRASGIKHQAKTAIFNNKFPMKFSVREMLIEDAGAIAGLSHQLGYEMTVEATTRNIVAILANKDHVAFVALDNVKVIGWTHVFNAIHIESPSFSEIRGLVVDEKYRRKGIGRLLISQAKQWSLEKGIRNLRLRCNSKRTEAHLFYSGLGFRETKQQKVFEISI